MAKRFIIVGILIAILFAGLIGFDMFRKKMMAQFFASMTPPPAPVAAMVAISAPVPRTLEAVGTIAAVRQVTVSPEIGGRVTALSFEAGQTVRAGDLLVQLNDEPEQGDLANYQAQEKLATLNLERATKLVNVAAPRSQVDQFRAQQEQARAGIARSQALINQKQVRAPFDGVLGIRQVDLGEYLNPGQAVVSLTDLSELFVNFSLPETALSELQPGQAVKLSVDAWPDRAFAATISAIEPQVGTGTRTVNIQATTDNRDNLLTPGMYARAEVVLPQGESQVIVPETAVDFTIYGDSVFVVKDDGKDDQGKDKYKVDRVFVKAGKRFDNRVAIAEGLKTGDRVVTSGQIKLQPGASVVIAPSDKLAEDYEANKDKPRNE